MSAPCILNTAISVYIGKSGRPVNHYDKDNYCLNRELYEAVSRDIRKSNRYVAMIIWQILANNSEGFIYKFSEAYFMKYWDFGHTVVGSGRKKLIELGYLVPVEKKPYDYIFYADANGLLWEREKETQKRISEKYQKRIQKNAAHREEWFAKVAERDRLKEEQKQLEEQQNNGNQSDENNKKADAE